MKFPSDALFVIIPSFPILQGCGVRNVAEDTRPGTQ
jgi:hypothetical protein